MRWEFHLKSRLQLNHVSVYTGTSTLVCWCARETNLACAFLEKQVKTCALLTPKTKRSSFTSRQSCSHTIKASAPGSQGRHDVSTGSGSGRVVDADATFLTSPRRRRGGRACHGPVRSPEGMSQHKIQHKTVQTAPAACRTSLL